MYNLIAYRGLEKVTENIPLETGLTLMREANKENRTCYLAPV